MHERIERFPTAAVDEFTGRAGEGSVADWVTWIIDLLREHAVAPVFEHLLGSYHFHSAIGIIRSSDLLL